MLKEILLYISLFTIAILCWWITWREIPSKKASECPGGVSNAEIKPVKIYTGKWRKDYLEVGK